MTENFEAEAAVLGSVLVDGTLFKQLIISDEHFHFANHKKIFQAMRQADEQGKPIDAVTVTTFLGDAYEEVGGATYLVQLAEAVASIESIKHYEAFVLEAYRNRKIREISLRHATSPDVNQLDVFLKELQALQTLGTAKQTKTTYDHLIEIADEMISPKAGYSGLLTDYKELDAMTGGLQRGDLIIIAARPSVGKTAFALNLAAGLCENQGMVHIFSLEMGTKQLLKRLISAKGLINSQKWRTMQFSKKDYERAFYAIDAIASWDLQIFEQKRTLAHIRASILQAVHEHPEKAHTVIIDYLQLIKPIVRRDRRDLEVGEITRELKLLAMELNIPIVLLSQLSRGVESRQDKRPMMSDLRDSGNIEQDADVVAFLYRENYYNRQAEEGNQLEVIIGKQRNGPTGTVKLEFQREYGRFVG